MTIRKGVFDVCISGKYIGIMGNKNEDGGKLVSMIVNIDFALIKIKTEPN